MKIGRHRRLEFREILLGFMRFEQLVENIGPRTFGRSLDDVEQTRDMIGNASGFRSEPDRTHGRDKENPFAVLPNMQPGFLKIGTEPIDRLGRERPFFFPGGTDAVPDLPVTDIAAGNTAHFHRFSTTDHFFEIGRPEMGFDFLERLELDRLGFLRGAENGNRADLLFPFLDDRRVVDDFDLPQKFVEIHPAAKARLVELAQCELIAVMAGRPQQNAAQPAAGHAGEIALRRFGLRGFLHVILIFHLPERIALGGCPVRGDRTALADLEKRIGGSIGTDAHAVPLRLVQKHASQPIERIGAVARLDLFGQCGDAARLRQKFDRERDIDLLLAGSWRARIGRARAVSGTALRIAGTLGPGKTTARAAIIAGTGSGLRATRSLAGTTAWPTAWATVGTAPPVATAAAVKITTRRLPGIVRVRVLVVRLFEPVG